MKLLGIETSCDETSASVVENGSIILSNVIASQTELFQRFGGVVPEVASRRHVELIIPTIKQALKEADCSLSEINAVAVINRPGLIPALVVGVSAAKALAWAADLPIVAVHHLEAHIYANFLEWEGKSMIEHDEVFPAICLIVSGGHSEIVLMHGHCDYEIIARTRDDAAGEAFDKCARAMGLGYPGGPIISKLAENGSPNAIKFPRAKVKGTLDFSFSGLKTAVIRYIKENNDARAEDIAASLEQAIVDVLVKNTLKAAEEYKVKHIMLAGGVAANRKLQNMMRKEAAEIGISVSSPPAILCTDNAAMAAAAGYQRLLRGDVVGHDLDAAASAPLAHRINTTQN